MIRVARPEEVDAVCARICEIDPWKRLRILGGELAHGLRIDPLRRMIVWQEDEGSAVGGALIMRVHSGAELPFYRGFGQIMAARYHAGWPCNWRHVPDGGYIGSLAVLEGQTGRGIGLQLIDAAHETFVEMGHAYCWLLVSGFNHGARRFYERNGYRCIGYVDNCLLPGNREQLMERRL